MEKAPLGNWYLFIFETKNKKLVLLILDWMEYFIYDFQRGSKNIDSSKKDDDQVKLPQIRRWRPSHWRHCPCYAESKYLYVSLFVLGFFFLWLIWKVILVEKFLFFIFIMKCLAYSFFGQNRRENEVVRRELAKYTISDGASALDVNIYWSLLTTTKYRINIARLTSVF